MNKKPVIAIVAVALLVILVIIGTGMSSRTIGIPSLRGYLDDGAAEPAPRSTRTGSARGGGCFPTAESPRYRCIPRDSNGNVGQLGGVLPEEFANLPAQFLQ
jgi:hypothetical protein